MLVLSAVLFTCFGLGDLLGHRDLPGSPEMANYLIAADEQRDISRRFIIIIIIIIIKEARPVLTRATGNHFR